MSIIVAALVNIAFTQRILGYQRGMTSLISEILLISVLLLLLI